MSFYCPTHTIVYSGQDGCPQCRDCKHEFKEIKNRTTSTVVPGKWENCAKCGLTRFVPVTRKQNESNTKKTKRADSTDARDETMHSPKR